MPGSSLQMIKVANPFSNQLGLRAHRTTTGAEMEPLLAGGQFPEES